jgi:hypothetical protein
MKKLLVSALLLISLALASCAQTSDGNINADTSASIETAAEETTAAYPYELKEFDGYTFTFLNQEDDFWTGSHHILDYESETGDAVNDAIYQRCRKTEDDLGIGIEVIKGALDNNALRLSMEKAVMANEDVYDAVYLPLNYGGSTSLTGKYVLNLHDISTLNLENEWWNQTFIAAATIGDNRLYTTIDFVNMMGYAYCNALYFNKNMIVDYGLEEPYDLVRNGSWTYDKFFEYIAPVVNLNSDDSFKPAADGTCIYGISGQHSETTMTLLDGCGDFLITKNDQNLLELDSDIERIITAYDKLTDALSRDGWCVLHNTSELQGLDFFLRNRAMFYIGSLGGSNSSRFRVADVEYGILPLPKLDEKQEDYCTIVSQYTFALNIPMAASDPERTGAIIDYMAFLGWRDILPVLQTAFCYKGLRDEDSIEMMNILLDTRTVDLGVVYGWTADMLSTLCTKMLDGNHIFVSTYETSRNKIIASIEKTFSE